jgi:hypothetical protein
MAAPRTKSMSTKVTEAEYDGIVDRAHPSTVSEWMRDVVLGVLHPDPLHFLVLAEVVALRTILLNLNFALSRNEPASAGLMQSLIDRADAEKFDKARERLARLTRAVESTGGKSAIDKSTRQPLESHAACLGTLALQP